METPKIAQNYFKRQTLGNCLVYVDRKILKKKSNYYRYIPSEKIGQNFHPSESSFFVINYQHWTGRSAFRPFLALPDHSGGLGGPWGVMGGL